MKVTIINNKEKTHLTEQLVRVELLMMKHFWYATQ